jgi:hypothetical protein
MFLEYLLKALKYGNGELDYNLFLNDTFKGYNIYNDSNIKKSRLSIKP